MAWNPFRRTSSSTRTAWGYDFDWTDEHQYFLDRAAPLKQSYDVLAEECLTVLDRISPPPSKDLPRTQPRSASGDVAAEKPSAELPPQHRDLYNLLCEHHDADPKLQELWTQLSSVPDWVDWDQIARGQDVFYRYGGASLTGLAYQSLLGGFAAGRVVEVLARTGGFSTKVARRRLFETTQHILQCTRSLESLQPGGEGFASSIRVRFLHAAVRRRILQLNKTRPDYFNVEEWGVPINELDSIATISSFSSTLIWLSLPRQGIFMRRQETEDYVALWRYIGHLMGSPVEPYFETPRNAKAVMDVLMLTELKPTETSKLLANNVIRSLDDQPPGYASADFLIAGARWLNGNELGDALGLARPSWYYWALFAGQNVFFCTLCYVNRSVSRWDRRKVAMLKELFYKLIVDSRWALDGQASLFEFKHVPEYSTVTELADGDDTRPRMRGVEARALKWLAAGALVVAGSVYVAVQVTTGLVRVAVHAWR